MGSMNWADLVHHFDGVDVPTVDGALQAAKRENKGERTEWKFTPELLEQVKRRLKGKAEALWYIRFLHLQGLGIVGAEQLTLLGPHDLRDLVRSGVYSFGSSEVARLLESGWSTKQDLIKAGVPLAAFEEGA